jgi:WD40 repeat protein
MFLTPYSHYNSKGQAVFMVAALGIILDPETNKMTTFGGVQCPMVAKNVADDSKFHMDDILSLDVSYDRKTVVSGQVGKAPSVHVWDAETGESKFMFKLKDGSRGVAAISISPCQRYVACVDLHNDHHVVIYNIKRGKQLMTRNPMTLDLQLLALRNSSSGTLQMPPRDCFLREHRALKDRSPTSTV